jgi:hypothetical protein
MKEMNFHPRMFVVVGRIEKRKISSAAERLNAGGLDKHDTLANP